MESVQKNLKNLEDELTKKQVSSMEEVKKNVNEVCQQLKISENFQWKDDDFADPDKILQKVQGLQKWLTDVQRSIPGQVTWKSDQELISSLSAGSALHGVILGKIASVHEQFMSKFDFLQQRNGRPVSENTRNLRIELGNNGQRWWSTLERIC